MKFKQKSQKETKIKTCRRKPKILEGNQKFQKETKKFRKKPKIWEGRQSKILEGN